MANVSVTDQTQVNVSVDVSETAPLSLASLKTLKFSNIPIVSDFAKPMDQMPLDHVGVELGLSSPPVLFGGNQAVGFGGGLNASFTLRNAKQKTLFDNDEFAPVWEISPGECWAGFTLNFQINAGIGTAAVAGFGVFLEAGHSAAHATFVHFPTAGATLPNFKDGVRTALERYSVPPSAEQLLDTPAGIAHMSDVAGSVAIGALYATPLTVNPLATASLPFNFALNISPSVGGSITASITLEGDFVVRTFRPAENKCIIGLYKKRQTTFKAAISAGAGVGVFAGSAQTMPTSGSNDSDILTKVLNAVVPGVNTDGLQLSDSQKAELNAGLKHCVDHSLSLAVNACCTAIDADEAAVIYELTLSAATARETGQAVTAALRGDWSLLGTLANARPLRHVLRDLKDRNHKVNINLLGLYNATSITDYLKSTTILQDENGHITMVDKVSAESLAAGTAPYAAKAEKLRFALTQAFVATVTYGACAGKDGLNAFSVRQSFLEYKAQASCADLKSQLALAAVFGFSAKPELQAVADSRMPLTHNKFYVETNYDLASVYRFFYHDPDQRTPYAPAEIDRIGRETRIALLDPMAPNSMARRKAMADDAVWAAMNEGGNVALFKSIPGLAKLTPAALQAIAADWTDIRWWSDAMQGLTPHLTAVLVAGARSSTSDPMQDAALVAARQSLQNALARLTAKTHSAFRDGWPIAVMFRLATGAKGAATSVPVEIDLSVNGVFQNQLLGPRIAKSKSNSV